MFANTEYCVLGRWKISSDSKVLFNNKEVGSFSRSRVAKYNLYGTKSRDLIFALKNGKSHFKGKFQFYCTRLAYISKAETVVFASKV